MLKKKLAVILCVLLASSTYGLRAQTVQAAVSRKADRMTFALSNNEVIQQVFLRGGMLLGDALSGQTDWLARYHNADHGVATDGNFRLKMMWTDWSAPGKVANADVQVSFSKRDYRYSSYKISDIAGGGKALELYFTPLDHANTIQLRLTYQLLPGKFYARRQVAVRDTVKASNWLDVFISRTGKVRAGGGGKPFHRGTGDLTAMHRSTGSKQSGEANRVVKKGAFGQPCAIDFSHGGVFFGVEYPAATTTVDRVGAAAFNLSCKEIIGTVVKDQWVASKWVVEGLAPDQHVKLWFDRYLPDIKIAPTRPYALYNSWYDLRTPVYPKIAPEHVMNEKNILHIIDLFKKNMIEPYGIHLNAFVLDDGWDVHHSDWQLRKTTFPHGLKPISDELKKLGTTLGIWFGPTGGYSFRTDRIKWMGDHGYEVVGHGGDAMMCIGGKKYSALFQKRTTDMVKNAGVGYFKWDGIQFSCSNPTHGHPTGYYSRRAILDSVIAKCKAVRAVNPKVYLNITSGTWLSPWWMKYANQIWMQGGDYGFADVPSVSQRDASMTYKDLVLYNDFHRQDDWFPISNLMTHGIIKGALNEIGGADDPLNKFTNDAMFYFGRGVTMYELYVSPNLLSKGEWNALSKSLKWAEDRFFVLENTDMVGGDPTKGEAYGYVHYKKSRGILAVRNPSIGTQDLRITLDPKYGIDPDASSLVLERVYPTHWISPDLYAAGATVDLPLSGYETAIYEVYPLDSARGPLLAGATYSLQSQGGDHYDLHILQTGKTVRILNPAIVSGIKVGDSQMNADDLKLPGGNRPQALSSKNLSFHGDRLQSKLSFGKDVLHPRFVVFLHPDSAYKGKGLPEGKLLVDGKEVKATKQQQKGVWSVYSYPLPTGEAEGAHRFEFRLSGGHGATAWKGSADVWLMLQQRQPAQTVSITTKEPSPEKPMPPSPYETDAIKKDVHLGDGRLSL
ncbi:MAG TPA: alpha-galactosidase [Chitinophagaceae bacterium]|nr:alpha-galactosidase [Chitinophagaceae bacterium]